MKYMSKIKYCVLCIVLTACVGAALSTSGCVWPKRRYMEAGDNMTAEDLYRQSGVEVHSESDRVALTETLAAGKKFFVPYEYFEAYKRDERAAGRGSQRAAAGRRRFIWPVQGATVSSEFGYRWNRFHEGIDLVAPIGTPVHASAGGVVIYAANEIGGFGNMVVIKHDEQTATVYAHLQRIDVNKSQQVPQGHRIGTLGNTGRTTGAHLHFEIRKNRKPIDPVLYLDPVRKKSWADVVIR